MVKHVLLADDDPAIRALVGYVLRREGYRVYEAQDGVEAVDALAKAPMDLAIIDVMMPRMNGLELCAHVREQYDIPIIMLTAKDQLRDKEQGYAQGTDDYVTKPFEPEELVFRTKALFRRYNQASSDVLRLNRMTIDRKSFEVTDGAAVFLLPMKEFELLAQLAQYPGRLFSRDDLIRLVWGADYEGDERTVDVHIKRLRQRFAEYAEDFVIQTVRGIGYKLEVKGR